MEVKLLPATQRAGDGGIPVGNGIDKWTTEGGAKEKFRTGITLVASDVMPTL